jgi:hypothetical protein
MSVSPPVDQRVRSDARNLSPGTMFNVPSATHQMLAHLAGQGDEKALSTLQNSSPMGGKPAPPEPKEKEPVPKRIDTVKVIVKAIDLSTPEGSENSLYTFSSTCRALGIPREGLNSVEEEALALLVDKWTTSIQQPDCMYHAPHRCAERLATAGVARRGWST